MRFLIATLLLASSLGASAECSQKDLQGRWVGMFGVDDIGVWDQCSLKITSTGRVSGRCLLSDGTVVPAGAGQFKVNPDCSVTSESDNGFGVSSGRIQVGKRGIIGRSFYDDGRLVFEGPYVAVKR